jgi:hypothetical protein
MPKENGPYKTLTTAEVKKAEHNSFVILIGNDFYAKNGDYTFSIAQAEKYYEILLSNILHTIDNGNPKQQSAALKCLARLHILPLRLH